MDRRSLLRAILTAPALRLVPLPPVPAIFRVHLGPCATLTFTPITGHCELRFKQDQGRAICWPSNIRWVSHQP